MNPTFHTLSMADVTRIFRAVMFVEELSREPFNRNSVTGAVPAVRRRSSEACAVEVTGARVTSPPEDVGLYTGTMYVPDPNESPPWRTGTCWVRELPDKTLSIGDIGVGKLVGVRDGTPVYVLANAVGELGCGITRDEDGKLTLDYDDIVGPGTEVVEPEEEGDCRKIGVKTSCHIKIDNGGAVSFDDSGFLATNSGLQFVTEGPGSCKKLKADRNSLIPQLVGTAPNNYGMTTVTVDGNTFLAVDYGCGLTLNAGGKLIIDNVALAGLNPALTGLIPVGVCGLKVDAAAVGAPLVVRVKVGEPTEELVCCIATRTQTYREVTVTQNAYGMPFLSFGEEDTEVTSYDHCLRTRCCFVTVPFSAVFTTDPDASNSNPGATGPVGQTVDFTAVVAGGLADFTYEIDYDDPDGDNDDPVTKSGTDHTFTHSFGAAGLYEVRYTVTDACGCSVTKLIPVVISEECPTCENNCPDGYPPYYEFELTGGTGDFAGANGEWKLWHGDDSTDPNRCFYYWINEAGWVAVGYILGEADTFTVTLTSPTGATIEYGFTNTDEPPGEPPPTCCKEQALASTDSEGTGTVPSVVDDTAEPGCTECPLDPIDSECCPGNPIPGRIYLKVKDPGTLATVATVTLNNPDDTFWRGSGVLPCGQVIYFRYAHPDILGCALEWSCNNVNWTPVSAIVDCDQSCSPFCVPGIQFDLTGTGCVACSGTPYRATLSGTNDDTCACP